MSLAVVCKLLSSSSGIYTHHLHFTFSVALAGLASSAAVETLMVVRDLVQLMFLLILVLVAAANSQYEPQFEFRGNPLANNSYILRAMVGEGHNDSLHCVTNNSDCCNNGQGNWYNVTGGEVQQGPDGDSNLYVTRGDGVIHLNRRRGGQSGMWRCDISDNNDIEQNIYIYLGTPVTGNLL